MLGNGRTQDSVGLEYIHYRHGQKNLPGEGSALAAMTLADPLYTSYINDP